MKITLANLHLATAQQVFDQVVGHLRAQNAKSLGKDLVGDVCQYRGEGGRMCAASCLISDEEYLPKMEGRAWNGLISDGLVKTELHCRLITELQRIHDISSVDDWEDKLAEVAYKFNLIYTMNVIKV